MIDSIYTDKSRQEIPDDKAHVRQELRSQLGDACIGDNKRQEVQNHVCTNNLIEDGGKGRNNEAIAIWSFGTTMSVPVQSLRVHVLNQLTRRDQIFPRASAGFLVIQCFNDLFHFGLNESLMGVAMTMKTGENLACL